MCGGLIALSRRVLIPLKQQTRPGDLDLVKLPMPCRPDEGDDPRQCEQQGRWQQYVDDAHWRPLILPRLRLLIRLANAPQQTRVPNADAIGVWRT